MKKYILNPISLFFIGAILGIISKLLDILFVGNLFMMTLGYMFSNLPIWVLLGILISIYSDTRKKAMINIFPFCIGMLISYYVTAELTNAVYSWNFIAFICLFYLENKRRRIICQIYINRTYFSNNYWKLYTS